MKLTLVTLAAKMSRSGPAATLVQEYVARCQRLTGCTWEIFKGEEKLLAFVETQSGRSRATLILGDSSGVQMSSVEFAGEIRKLRDSGCQTVVLAIGPADGWTAETRRRADMVFAFGRITLPHELAAVVLAEQVYRALTILAGHPYHSGH